MPEIHRLSDYNTFQDVPQQRVQLQQTMSGGFGQYQPRAEGATQDPSFQVFMPDGALSEPKKFDPESVTVMKLFSPNFRWLTLLNLLIFVQLVLYFSCIIYFPTDSNYFQISPVSLLKFGAITPDLLRKGEVWRLFTALLLHVNLIHLTLNSGAQIMFITHFEKHYGIVRFGLFYLICGLSGNLFSVITNNDVLSAGASTAIFSFFGLLAGEIIIFWHRIEWRYIVVSSTIMLLLISLLVWPLVFEAADLGLINFFAHLGGILTGLFVSPAVTFSEPNKPKWHKTAFIVGAVLWVLLVIISALVLYVANG